MGLRFAALRRVSTERQAKRGESLKTQTNQIESAVKSLGGSIVGWYGGQEHATPNYEHHEVERLLIDATEGRFDAVIVSHADRWSRDNATSKRGLRVFRDAGVKFYVLTTEHDLYNASACLFLGMSAEIGEYQASVQKQKSRENRLAKAKRGCCVCGKKPWGRIWDKKNESWSVDSGKQNMIEDIAERYLSGESLEQLAKEYNQNPSNLHKTLTQRCGDVWVQTFRHENGKVDEIETPIPRLLSDKTIAKIKSRLAANKTYSHGEIKNRYLLSRMIFCKHCGYAMFGQTNAREDKRRYYRHCHASRSKPCKIKKTWVPASEIEELVMFQLFECFGNAVAIKKAVDAATPNVDEIRRQEERIVRIDGELEKIKKGRDRTLAMIFNDTISDEQAESRLLTMKEREQQLRDEQSRLSEALSSRMSDDQVKRVAKQTSRWFASSKPLSQMSYEDKRGLVEMVFGGHRPDGSRMGVYITWKDGTWTFDIYGRLISEEGLIRWSEPVKAVMREHYESGASWAVTKSKALSTEQNSYSLMFTLSGTRNDVI